MTTDEERLKVIRSFARSRWARGDLVSLDDLQWLIDQIEKRDAQLVEQAQVIAKLEEALRKCC